METKIQSIPEASCCCSSLRSVGYNEETAIADIVDNCISAQAHKSTSNLTGRRNELSLLMMVLV